MWSTLDHAERIVASLPAWMRSKVRLPALARAIGEVANLLEADLDDLIVQRTLETATGASLRQYAELVGETPEAFTEDELRRLISGRIVSNRSGGSLEDLVLTLLACYGDWGSIYQTYEYPPAALEITIASTEDTSAEFRRRVRRIMEDAKPAGVRLLITEAPAHLGAFFAFDTPGAGFGDGYFARSL